MSTALDWVGNGEPAHLDDFVRLRAAEVPDPDNPDATIQRWTEPIELPLRGSWNSGGSAYASDPVRQQLSTRKTIAIFDPDADVRAGDRVRAADGAVFTVTGRPERDSSPWTGWRPTLVLEVEEVTG